MATIEEYNSIYNSAKDAGDYELAVNALIEKADIERRIYSYETPYETLSEAKELLESHIPLDNFLWFRTYLSFGQVTHIGADYYRATSYLDSAQILYSKSITYDSALYSDFLEYKFYGYLYSNKSIDTVQKYIDIRLIWENEEQKRAPNPENLMYLLEDYPDIYSQKGEYDIALAYAISNYKYFKQNIQAMNSARFGEVYYDLSLALFRKDQFETALEIVDEYQNADESMLNNEYYAGMISLVGLIYNEMGDYTQSIEYFERFLDMQAASFSERDQQNQKIARATAFLNMGINLYELGETEKAISNYNRSLEEMKAIVDFPSSVLINCYRYIGDFQVREGNWKEALISYDSALRNTELKYQDAVLDFPNKDSISRFSLESLTILKKKSKAIFNNYEQDPITYLESAINYVDHTHERIRANRDDLYKSDGKLFLSQFFKELYETGIDASFQLFSITGDEQYAWKAFKYAQLSKSNLFLEQEKDYKEFTSSDIPFSLKENYYLTTARLDSLKGILYNTLDNSVTGDSVLRLSEQIITLEDRTAFLKDSISKNYLKSPIDQYENQAIDNLESESLLIEYFYGNDHIYSFGVNAGREIVLNRTESDSLLKSNLEGFLKIVSNPPDYESFDDNLKRYRRFAADLYKRLLDPILEMQKSRPEELVIVADEFLTRVPFEAFLVDENVGNTFWDFDYLINSFNVRYLISSNVSKTASSTMSNDYKILGIGFSQVDKRAQSRQGAYASLPGTEREIQFLEASFEGDYYLGERGSRSRFLTEARNYDIIHLAVHGKADENRFQSRLIFNGKDSVLNTNQLYLANIKAKLTVLSACESGKGQIESGEGTFSIARGFAIVGVPNIVMSLWEVNDRITSSQMVEFYNNFLSEKQDLNSSLRKVKLDYIKDGDSYLSHPYYWASFIHVGQNTSLEKSFIGQKWMLYLIGLFFIIGVMIFVSAKKRKGIQ
ncbi:MAG: CHAT domain-containing protein [Roseivirga sp.]|uniref:CHAT domain-containing protein n=1 Tax=Roseivirga TaxID=290180 RepID=UPI0016148699|nr:MULTISPECIES: CHAT domain-containing tetratricopeptide repeat protein [Roseivirga]MBO6661153.1 CHAT domain-containing protein [Roseivirga sp.]MBO6908863.1 CHAT domain-containing protein [Roseivirga sp.]